jgi:penicillin-binding protein 1C
LAEKRKNSFQSDRENIWFVLPPAMEYYYRKYHPGYRTLPLWLPGSNQRNEIQMIELIYPDDRLMVYLPKNNEGHKGQVIFQAAHRKSDATIFWHLDGTFLGSTKDFHQMGAAPTPGNHQLLIVDELGNSTLRHFKVVE